MSQLIKGRVVSLNSLAGKVIAVDALNAIYQFLAIIRLFDGSLLTSEEGRVTSHVMGLFYRTLNFLEHNISPVYVFDGKPPPLKRKTLEERAKVKERFQLEWLEALREGDFVKAFKKSVMTAKVDDAIVSDARKVLDLMSVPYVQAPSEGEAQAAYMVVKGDAWASASQDFDSLLFGSPRLVRNLTIAGKKYYPKKGIAVDLAPEMIESDAVLRKLKISHRQLVDLSILIGTDYNEGVRGVGPKKALRLIRAYGSAEKVLRALNAKLEADLNSLRDAFLKAEVTDRYSIVWREPDYSELKDYLLSLNFSPERVSRGVERLRRAMEFRKQAGLSRWT